MDGGKVSRRGTPMKKLLLCGWLHLALRMGLGALFIYSGAMKMRSPLDFADSIASFSLLPNEVINVFALALPAFELLVGSLCLSGFHKRLAGFSILLALMVFFIALIQALLRGLLIDCGCFGSQVPSTWTVWKSLGRDILLIGCALLVYWNLARRDILLQGKRYAERPLRSESHSSHNEEI